MRTSKNGSAANLACYIVVLTLSHALVAGDVILFASVLPDLLVSWLAPAGPAGSP